MKRFLAVLLGCALILTSCARDLSSDMYTSDSTMSLTMEGTVIAVRKVKINESDKLSDNSVGIMSGGAAGAALGMSSNEGAPMIIGGALIGGLVGAGIQNKLGQSDGFEYIVKIETEKLKDTYYEGSSVMRSAISAARTSGIITIVQNTKDPLSEGQRVYLIVSDKRARIIPHN